MVNLSRNISCLLTPYSDHRMGLKLEVTKREEQDRELSGRYLGRQMLKIRPKTAQYRQRREGKTKVKKPHNKRKSWHIK